MDVLHLTSAHVVRDTRIFIKEAQSLAAAGFRVGILGPGERHETTQESGVELITLPRPRTRAARFTVFMRALKREVIALRPRCVHIHDPDLLIIGRSLSAQGILVVYDVHEDYGKALLSRTWIGPRGLRKLASRLARRAERRAIGWLSGIVLADDQLRPHFAAARHLVVVRNFVRTEEWRDIAIEAHHGPPRCLYVGDITEARGLWQMCGAIADQNLARSGVELDLIGPIAGSLASQLAASSRLRLHGRQPREEVARLMAQASVGFCLLEPTPAYREALPVKVLEYLAAGLPVVCTTLPRLASETALHEGLVMVDWPARPSEVALAVKTAAAIAPEVRTSLRNRVLREYSWDGEAKKLVEFYHGILGTGVQVS